MVVREVCLPTRDKEAGRLREEKMVICLGYVMPVASGISLDFDTYCGFMIMIGTYNSISIPDGER